jgi:hypothetical protein
MLYQNRAFLIASFLAVETGCFMAQERKQKETYEKAIPNSLSYGCIPWLYFTSTRTKQYWFLDH